ncbi:Cullin-1 [Asimina triloba]
MACNEKGLALIKFAEDAATQKKAESRDSIGLKQQVLVRSLMELHERKWLARRLLFDTCANVDHEGSFLIKLKRNFGGQFTSKMEGMVMDMSLAREKQKQFQIYLEKKAHKTASIGMAVTANAVGIFKKYYQTANRHSKLTFHILAVTLMLFNDSEKLSYQEIVSQLDLTDEDALRLWPMHIFDSHSKCGRFHFLSWMTREAVDDVNKDRR